MRGKIQINSAAKSQFSISYTVYRNIIQVQKSDDNVLGCSNLWTWAGDLCTYVLHLNFEESILIYPPLDFFVVENCKFFLSEATFNYYSFDQVST